MTLLDRARNEDVRWALRQDALLDVVKAKTKAWREKLKQMEDDRLVKRVYEEVVRKRPRGHLRKRWHENFQ